MNQRNQVIAHCTNILCSQQIRPPIYSLKQSKLRRRRVIRFAILYFVLAVVMIALIVGPVYGGKAVPASLNNQLSDIAGFRLLQPNHQNHDNTNGTQQTGTGAPNYTGAGRKTTSTGAGAGVTGKIRLF